MSLSPGQRLGPYEIVNLIGSGGMGSVYRAHDARLDRAVAIKVLPEAFAADPDRRGRFEREAKTVAALSHPNILAIFDVGDERGVFYVATELLEGVTLREQLQSSPLPPRKAIELGVQMARGLAAAHDKGIVHRDLKPENLFVAIGGQIKILDFGIAKAVAPDAPAAQTRTNIAATDPGMVMGTIGYMAPEQVRGLAVDARSDLFSFGAVLYEMVTGRRAFERATAADTMSAILREDPPEMTGPHASMPSGLDRIIRHCLEKDPAERFQNARDVAFALGALTGSATNPTVAVAAMPGRASRRGWLWVAAVIAAAAGGVLLGRAMNAPAPPASFIARTHSPQTIYNARFMPGGTSIVFSSVLAGGVPALFESRDANQAPRQFGPPRTHLLSVSKTGELAILTEAEPIFHRMMRGTLAKMTIEGAPRAIAKRVREADWLPDGTDLVVVRDESGHDQIEFPLGKVVYRTPGYVTTPRVSPDGTRVAFMDHQTRYDNRGWVKVVDRSGKVTSVSPEYPAEEGLAWSADGRRILYSAAQTSDYRVYAVPVEGGAAPEPTITAPGSLVVHDVGPGGQLIVTNENTRYGVSGRGKGQDVERELTPLDQAWSARLSRDGSFAVFTDGRGGHDYAVVLRAFDGKPAVRLGDGDALALSPDERWVAATLPSTERCVVYPTGAGSTVPIEMGPLASCVAAGWFPDGKNLLITGREAGKPTRVYRAAFPGGVPTALLPEGVEVQQMSADGRSFIVTQEGQASFLKMEIGGKSTPLKGLDADDTVLEWSADQRSAIVALVGVPSQVLRVNLETGVRAPLGELAPADRAGLLFARAVAYRDGGKQYLYSFVRRVSALYVMTTR